MIPKLLAKHLLSVYHEISEVTIVEGPLTTVDWGAVMLIQFEQITCVDGDERGPNRVW